MTPYSFRKEVIGTPEAGGPFIAHAYTDAGIFWQYSVEGSECGLKFDDLPPGYTDQWRRARKVCVRRRKVSRNSSKSTAVKVRPVLRHLDATRDGTFAELSRIACIRKTPEPSSAPSRQLFCASCANNELGLVRSVPLIR